MTQQSYTVHAFVPVRVTVKGIVADSQQSAIQEWKTAANYHDLIDPVMQKRLAITHGIEVPQINAIIDSIEYSEDSETMFLVDEHGDEEFDHSKWYDGDGKTATDWANPKPDAYLSKDINDFQWRSIAFVDRNKTVVAIPAIRAISAIKDKSPFAVCGYRIVLADARPVEALFDDWDEARKWRDRLLVKLENCYGERLCTS